MTASDNPRKMLGGWNKGVIVVQDCDHLSNVFLCTRRGVYLASLVYTDDSKVLVTVDDQVPIVEVSDSHSSAIGVDFVWLAKVSREEEGRGGGEGRTGGEDGIGMKRAEIGDGVD